MQRNMRRPAVRRPQDGYIALLAVLIVGAASVAISTALLVGGADSSRLFLAEQQAAQARQLAAACAEEALQVVHDNNAYTGTAGLTLGQGNCNYTVTNTGSAARTVVASATVNNVVRRTTVYVTIGTSSISVTSWQDTP